MLPPMYLGVERNEQNKTEGNEMNEENRTLTEEDIWADEMADGYGEVLDAMYGGQEF